MKDTRDLRDPERLGLAYLMRRKKGQTIDRSVTAKVKDYKDTGPLQKYGRPQDLPEG